ncbi:MAG: hypothetical protein LBS44_04610 [Deltaproteobacteria bacterium]|nr:hypothetical protein [Deltaproteobacteria bacterium]
MSQAAWSVEKVVSDSRKTKQPDVLTTCLNDLALLSANVQDLSFNYQDQLDKATVLCFQAAYANPDNSEVWKRLGLLVETKSFFVSDPKERSDLMSEASAHFAHAARLEFAHSENKINGSDKPSPPLTLSDPYLSELLWLGRLRRGEVNLAEVVQRYTAENLDPTHRPEFWQERALLIQATQDPEKKQAELDEARESFKKLWATMPVEVPWRGLADKFGPQKFKKVEVLEAWADGLMTIANQEDDPEKRTALFLEALELYKPALKLPLDLFEFKALLGHLDQAELQAPNSDSLLAVWSFKDAVIEQIINKFPNDISLWAAWGRDYYARSSRQVDYRIWLSYFQMAGEKYQNYVSKNSKPIEALHEWSAHLENKIYPDLSYLNLPDDDDKLQRVKTILELSLEKYREALALEPDRLTSIRALSIILLKISTFKPEEEFNQLLDESNRLAILAISRDPNTAGAWLQKGMDALLFAQQAQPGFGARNRLTAEAFAAFNQYLLSRAGQIEDLRLMADRVWQASENIPALRPQGLKLLVDICQRLILLDPKDPDYRFALGLSLYRRLAASPNWPDDLIFANSLATREAYEQALNNFETGLELLSNLERAAPSSLSLGLDLEKEKTPRLWIRSGSPEEDFLSVDPGPGAALVSASFQDRFSTSVKSFLARLINISSPELLPPWHQYRLASLFRRIAASAYPTPIDQMAFFRLADLYLTNALTSLSSSIDISAGLDSNQAETDKKTPSLRSLILAEKGLLFSEMSLLVEKDSTFLISSAENIWSLAEKDSPGSSRYAKARWAAWKEDPKILSPLLNHTADEQVNLLWPSFSEARLEPSFRGLIDQHWFKAAWFGYRR